MFEAVWAPTFGVERNFSMGWAVARGPLSTTMISHTTVGASVRGPVPTPERKLQVVGLRCE